MKMFFKTRTLARNFTNKSAFDRKVSDLGKDSEVGKRWAVKF